MMVKGFDGERNRSIAVFTKNRVNPAYAGARLGIDGLGRRFGCSVRHYVPEKADDIEEQRSLLRSALETDPDGIVFVPAHGTALNPLLEEAIGRGIPITCFVSRPVGVPINFFAGSDDIKLGYGIAEKLLSTVGSGNVVVIDGPPEALTTADRGQGFDQALRKHPSVKVAARFSGDYAYEPARARLAALLPTLPDIVGIITANDVMALGAVAAMDEAGRSAPVVGANAIPEAVDAVADGRLLATAAFNAMALGGLAFEALIRILGGEKVPAEISLPVEIVDRENYTSWRRPYAERPMPSWETVVASSAASGASGNNRME
jgi:ribose transport system substrate-binding protein